MDQGAQLQQTERRREIIEQGRQAAAALANPILIHAAIAMDDMLESELDQAEDHEKQKILDLVKERKLLKKFLGTLNVYIKAGQVEVENANLADKRKNEI